MRVESDKTRRESIAKLMKIANERSRIKHAIKLTWEALNIPTETQDAMMACILDGNRISEFERMINNHVLSLSPGGDVIQSQVLT